MKAKRICLLLDEPRIMKWVALSIEKATKKENVSFPLIIIKKNDNKKIKLTFQKIIIQILITFARKILGRQIELTDKLPIKQFDFLKNSRIYYSSAIKSGKYGTALPKKTLEKIKSEKIDLIFRRGFGILKGDILKCTPFGVLSYHTADIRKYRGASGTLESYLNNEKYIHISVQKINEALDKGELFYEKQVNITQCHSYREVRELVFDHLSDTFALAIKKMNSPEFKLIKPTHFGKHYGAPGIKDFPFLFIRYIITEIRRKFFTVKPKSMRPCFICSNGKKWIKKEKVVLKGESAEIIQCPNCGMIYNNLLDFVEAEVKDIYSDEDYGHYKLKDIKYREKNRAVMKRYKIGLIKRYVPNPKGKTFLDIGCSSGDLLQLAYREGFKVFGVEVSKSACAIAISKDFPLKIHNGEITGAKYPDNYFDVINISAVLTSIKDPHVFIKEVRRILKPTGYLFIEDNDNSHLLLENIIHKLIYKEIKDYKYWLNFFTIKTFKKFIEKEKFKLIFLEKLYYSDKVIQEYTSETFRNNYFIKTIFFLLRITKIDRMTNYCRLFEAILVKDDPKIHSI